VGRGAGCGENIRRTYRIGPQRGKNGEVRKDACNLSGHHTALAGMLLSDHLPNEIRQTAERPTLNELQTRC
jgi:hypothetical protein